MSRKPCPECHLTLPLSKFHPRHKAVYEQDLIPRMEEIWWQSRCVDCDPLYQKRRAFVNKELLPLAALCQFPASWRKRSTYRVVDIRAPQDDPRLRLLERAVEDFNRSLPHERSETARHGIRLVLAPTHAPVQQRALWPSLGSGADA